MKRLGWAHYAYVPAGIVGLVIGAALDCRSPSYADCVQRGHSEQACSAILGRP